MAMTRTESAEASMNRRWSLAAAAASVLLAAAGGVALLLLARQAPPEARLLPAALLWGAVALAALAGAVQLLRRDLWGQRILLVLWLVVSTAALIFTLYGALWDVPAWLGEMLGRGEEADLQTPGVLGALAVAVLAAAGAVLALRASAADSRLRYSGTVLVTSAAAVALLAGANMAAQGHSARVDLAQFGQYQMSERTRRIVQGVEEPLTLTCVYTGEADPRAGIKKAVAYRPRVLEFLRDLEELNPRVAVRNVTTEAGKRRLVDRLGRKLAGQFRQHRQLLEEFMQQAEALQAQLQKAGDACVLPKDSYLGGWGVRNWRGTFQNLGEKLGGLRDTIRRDLEKALIDYGQRVQELRGVLEEQANQLHEIEATLKALARLPELVQPRAEGVRTHVAGAVQAMRDLAASLGAAGDPVPDDPAAALKAYTGAAEAAAGRLRAAAEALGGLTQGTPLAQLVHARWTMPAMSRGGFRVEAPLGEWFGAYAEQLERYAAEVRAEIKTRTKEAQAQLLKVLRQSTPGPEAFVAAQQQAQEMLAQLTEVDPASRKLLRQMRDEVLLAPARKTLTELAVRAREVEETAPAQRSKEWAGEEIPDNVVVVETGGEDGRAALVPFEQVWQPRQQQRLGADEAERDDERVFHGDAAVSSTVLRLTARRPFAVVVLTYLGGAQMERAWPYMPGNLQALRERLEQANFEVRQWNLAASPEPPEESADDADADPLPKALLVLPPPPEALVRMLGMQVGRNGGPPPEPFSPEHLENIEAQIDAGTPAVFLAGWLRPIQLGLWSGLVQPPYPLERYLRGTWGIDVRTDYVLVPFIPDEDKLGQFRVDAEGFEYLPLNTFSDAHPISKPLAGQRVLWAGLCPVEIAQPPEGVDAEPLLGVRKGRRDLWAEPGIEEIRDKIYSGGLIAPDFPGKTQSKPDLAPPLTVAVAASRSADEDADAKQTRIVVLGVGRSLLDGHLDRKVYRLEGGLSVADPPRTNADLMINSLYWLIGREKYIAAGPARGKPIAPVPAGTERALKLVYWLGLPAVVIAVGVLVTLLRRRH